MDRALAMTSDAPKNAGKGIMSKISHACSQPNEQKIQSSDWLK